MFFLPLVLSFTTLLVNCNAELTKTQKIIQHNMELMEAGFEELKAKYASKTTSILTNNVPTTQTPPVPSTTIVSTSSAPLGSLPKAGFKAVVLYIREIIKTPLRAYDSSDHDSKIIGRNGLLEFIIDKPYERINIGYDVDIFNGVRELQRDNNGWFKLKYKTKSLTKVVLHIGDSDFELNTDLSKKKTSG